MACLRVVTTTQASGVGRIWREYGHKTTWNFFFKLTHEMTKYLYTVFPKNNILFIFFSNMKT